MKIKGNWTLPTGIDSFRELRRRNKYYVDKTMIISEFIEYDEKVALITRPRRFGKTLNMTTLRDFFDNLQENSDIFEGLAIMDTEYACQLGSRPTVYLTFKSCTGANMEALKESIAHVMKGVYFEYEKIFDENVNWESTDYYEFKKTVNAFKRLDDEDEAGVKYSISDSLVKRCLLVLVNTLAKYYQLPILLLIDEYDQPLLEAHNRGFRKEFSEDLYGPFLGDALKGNESLGQSLITGIQRVAKESIFSKLNNVAVYTVTNTRYATYFGLTEAETKLMLEDNGIVFTDEVKNYYDGYHIGGIDLYNPWSIVNYVKDKELAPYWINTSTNLLIRQLILNATESFNTDFENLILNGSVDVTANLEASFIELDTPATLWGLLINAGYLTVVERFGLNDYSVRIPNYEVKGEFRSIVELYAGTGTDRLAPLFNALFHKNMTRFMKMYQRLILEHVSFHDLPNDADNKIAENSFHMLFLGMSISVSGMYKIKSNRETGDGRSDILMTSLQPEERPHIIIEFKQGEDLPKLATEALEQIFNFRYYAEVTGQVLCIGISHNKKKCELVYQEIFVNEHREIV